MIREKVSTKSIYDDLTNIEKEFGTKIIKLICAVIIASFMWWNWPKMRDGFWEDLTNEVLNDN